MNVPLATAALPSDRAFAKPIATVVGKTLDQKSGKQVAIDPQQLIDDEDLLKKVCEGTLQDPAWLQMQLLSQAFGLGRKLGGRLGAIRECHDCRLDRLRTNKPGPSTRNAFEDAVVDDLRERFTDRDELLVLASFASGQLFQEFVLLNKLYYRGYKQIRLNLIDPIYDTMFVGQGERDKPQQAKPGSAAYQFSHYFAALQAVTGVYQFDIRYYEGVGTYLSDIASDKNLPSAVLFNIDSSVYDLTALPEHELGQDLGRLLRGGLQNTGVTYTLGELSDGQRYASMTLAASGESFALSLADGQSLASAQVPRVD